MKTLAVVFGLALVACSASSSESDARNTDQAVTGAKPYEPPVVEPTPPPPPPEPPAPTSCDEVRAMQHRSDFSISGNNIPDVNDVEAEMTHEAQADGTVRYSLRLRFSNVWNFSSYTAFGGFPVGEEFFEFTGNQTVAFELPGIGPTGEFDGNSPMSGKSECHDGGAGSSSFGSGEGSSHIVVTGFSNDVIEGTFELRDEDGTARYTGTFKAPIMKEAGSAFRNNKKHIICCLVPPGQGGKEMVLPQEK